MESRLEARQSLWDVLEEIRESGVLDGKARLLDRVLGALNRLKPDQSVTLNFRSPEAKEEFLAQLDDGIGEGWVDLDFYGLDLSQAHVIDVVEVYEDGGRGEPIR